MCSSDLMVDIGNLDVVDIDLAGDHMTLGFDHILAFDDEEFDGSTDLVDLGNILEHSSSQMTHDLPFFNIQVTDRSNRLASDDTDLVILLDNNLHELGNTLAENADLVHVSLLGGDISGLLDSDSEVSDDSADLENTLTDQMDLLADLEDNLADSLRQFGLLNLALGDSELNLADGLAVVVDVVSDDGQLVTESADHNSGMVSSRSGSHVVDLSGDLDNTDAEDLDLVDQMVHKCLLGLVESTADWLLVEASSAVGSLSQTSDDFSDASVAALDGTEPASSDGRLGAFSELFSDISLEVSALVASDRSDVVRTDSDDSDNMLESLGDSLVHNQFVSESSNSALDHRLLRGRSSLVLDNELVDRRASCRERV